MGVANSLVEHTSLLFTKSYKHCFFVQCHRGRATNHKVWVFGMVDLSQQLALGYIEVVPDRTAATLLPIIQSHTLPNTTIHSDQWQTYSRVGSLMNVNTHATVNHSLHFVGPVTGVHTQTIESYWARVKSKFKKMKGCHESQLPSYLAEFMWRERYINTKYHGSVIMFSHPRVQIQIEWRHVYVKHHWGHCTAVSCALNPPPPPPPPPPSRLL